MEEIHKEIENLSVAKEGISYCATNKDNIKYNGGIIMVTEIWKVDDKGDVTQITSYTLPSEEALIYFRQQNEYKNYNTWLYPKEDPAIKKYKDKNEYYYFKIDNTLFFTRTIK